MTTGGIRQAALSRRTVLRSLLLGGVTVAAGSALVACGGDDTPAPGTSSDPTTSGGAAGAGSVDKLTIALPGSLSSLDPNTEAGILNYYVASIVSEGLLGVDNDGALVPAVAESWDQPSPTTYVFTLRADATFADGTPVTVEDVLYSIEKARDPEASPGTAGYWPEITSVTSTGDREITIELPEPSSAFIWTLTNTGALWITSKAFFEKVGTLGTAESLVLGTGPYKVVEFKPDSHAVFEAVDTWWGGTPAVRTVRFDFIPDENTRLLARRSGDIDGALNVPLDQIDAWNALPDTEVLFAADRSFVGLLFNQNVAPFDDEHVRRAIAHCFDGESVVSSILRGRGAVATAVPTPEALAPILGEAETTKALDALTRYPFDLDAARAELARSSVPDGFSTSLTYPATGPQLGRAALALAENLKQIGIELEVTELPLEQWFVDLEDPEVGLHYVWYFSTTGDPAEVLGWYLRPENPYGYDDPEFVEQIVAAAQGTVATEVAAAVLAANEKSNLDAALLPMWWGQAATALSTRYSFGEYTASTLLRAWPAQLTAR